MQFSCLFDRDLGKLKVYILISDQLTNLTAHAISVKAFTFRILFQNSV